MVARGRDCASLGRRGDDFRARGISFKAVAGTCFYCADMGGWLIKTKNMLIQKALSEDPKMNPHPVTHLPWENPTQVYHSAENHHRCNGTHETKKQEIYLFLIQQSWKITQPSRRPSPNKYKHQQGSPFTSPSAERMGEVRCTPTP